MRFFPTTNSIVSTRIAKWKFIDTGSSFLFFFGTEQHDERADRWLWKRRRRCMSENLLEIVFHRSSARVEIVLIVGCVTGESLWLVCWWRESGSERSQPRGVGGGEWRRFVVIGILQSERSALGRTNTIHHVKLTTDKTFFRSFLGGDSPPHASQTLNPFVSSRSR